MILIIILSVTSSINFVTAQNETEISIANTKDENIGRNSEKVECLESGCINISFEDGYRGYCINYGKHEAEIGDSFSPENTSYATNRNTGEDVGNCLKTFFVEYYDHAMKDEIVTQHTIWHFTDDFNGWRLDYDLIDNIRSASSTKEIPDFGAVKKINNTTEAVFDFKVLKSGETDNQNFFIYKIIYRNIIPEILKSNSIFLKKQNGKYGYVDKDGNVVIDYIYDDAKEQNTCGFAAVKKDGKWGAIDSKGNVIAEINNNLDNYLEIDFIGKWHLGQDRNLNYYIK